MSYELKVVADWLIDDKDRYRPQITLFRDGRMYRNWVSAAVYDNQDQADEHAKEQLIAAESELISVLVSRADWKESEVS